MDATDAHVPGGLGVLRPLEEGAAHNTKEPTMTKKRTKRPTTTKPSDETGPVPTVARDPATDVDGQATEDAGGGACEEAGAHEGHHDKENTMPPLDCSHTTDGPDTQIAGDEEGEWEWVTEPRRKQRFAGPASIARWNRELAREAVYAEGAPCDQEHVEGKVCLDCKGTGMREPWVFDYSPTGPQHPRNEVYGAVTLLAEMLGYLLVAGARIPELVNSEHHRAMWLCDWLAREGGPRLFEIEERIGELEALLNNAEPWESPPDDVPALRTESYRRYIAILENSDEPFTDTLTPGYFDAE